MSRRFSSSPTPRSRDESIRLNRFLAECSICSRREADRLIGEGRVSVNGKAVYELGVKVRPGQDRVALDGKPVQQKSQKLYVLLNKPRGFLTTLEDPLERPTIKELLIDVPLRIYPVGRLDWDSEGLLLLTNDGEFAQRVMHPKNEVTKTYLVKISGKATAAQIERLRRGVTIIGGRVSARFIEKVNVKEGGKSSVRYEWYRIVISEGKNRQIRQMFSKIGYDVLKLQRVSIGKLKLESLKPGRYVFLNDVARERVFIPDLPAERRILKTPSREKKKEKPKPVSLKKTKKNLKKEFFNSLQSHRQT